MPTVGPYSAVENGYDFSLVWQSIANDFLYQGQDGSGDYQIGIRFTGVTGDGEGLQNATINLAELTVRVNAQTGTSQNGRVYGEYVDNSPSINSRGPFSGTPWVLTTAFAVLPTNPGTGLLVIDVTEIVQEIVDRGGYAEDGMSFAFDELGAATNFLEIEAVDQAGTDEPILEITYNEGGGLVEVEDEVLAIDEDVTRVLRNVGSISRRIVAIRGL